MTISEHEAIESLALAALSSLGDDNTSTRRGALYHHATQDDYYTLLGLAPTSTAADILNAVEAIRALDPSMIVMAAVDNAEAVLLNPALRAVYDAALAQSEE